MAHEANSLKSIFFALGANLAIAIAKFVAAFISGSGSMMAEAIHSTADSGNQLLLLLGIKQSKTPPNSDYPLGYGKAIYFWSFIVAIMLFSVGGLFSIYEGYHKLHSSEELNLPYIAIGVLIFSILAEGISLLGAITEIKKDLRGRTFFKWFKTTRKSDLLIVFGEDLAALLGLFFALIAIILTVITKNPIYDAMGSILIGILLVIVAVLVGKQIMSLLIGEGVEDYRNDEYIKFLTQFEDIKNILNIKTLQLGNDVMLAVKAEMVFFDSSDKIINSINNIEKKMKENFPEIKWSFFEPDNKDNND
jgi:cation diffusion facilitator family transporter